MKSTARWIVSHGAPGELPEFESLPFVATYQSVARAGPAKADSNATTRIEQDVSRMVQLPEVRRSPWRSRDGTGSSDDSGFRDRGASGAQRSREDATRG